MLQNAMPSSIETIYQSSPRISCIQGLYTLFSPHINSRNMFYASSEIFLACISNPAHPLDVCYGDSMASYCSINTNVEGQLLKFAGQGSPQKAIVPEGRSSPYSIIILNMRFIPKASLRASSQITASSYILERHL